MKLLHFIKDFGHNFLGFLEPHLNDENNFYDLIYIEDIDLFRDEWKAYFDKTGLNILVLDSTEKFHLHTKKISKEQTVIFLDSDLGKHVQPGENFAIKLHAEGFKYVCMASGQDDSHFYHIPWLYNFGKNVSNIGKDLSIVKSRISNSCNRVRRKPEKQHVNWWHNVLYGSRKIQHLLLDYSKNKNRETIEEIKDHIVKIVIADTPISEDYKPLYYILDDESKLEEAIKVNDTLYERIVEFKNKANAGEKA